MDFLILSLDMAEGLVIILAAFYELMNLGVYDYLGFFILLSESVVFMEVILDFLDEFFY